MRTSPKLPRREFLMIAFAVVLLIGLSAPLRAAQSGTIVRIPFARPGESPGSVTLEAEFWTPPGGGPFPLAVVSHGTSTDLFQRTAHPSRVLVRLRGWLLDHGYVVVIVMRSGFGSSGGGYAENLGPSCANYSAAGLGGADSIDSTLRYIRAQPFVDPARIVLLGQSGGGFASLAEASRNPEGVVGVVNFAGGHGSDGHDNVCNASGLVAAMERYGGTARIPSLWIYAENDHFFPPDLARRMFSAFAAGSPQAQFVLAPPYGGQGHYLVDSTVFWPQVVETFLNKVIGPH